MRLINDTNHFEGLYMDKPNSFFFNLVRKLFGRPVVVATEPTVPVSNNPSFQRFSTTYTKEYPTLIDQLREALKYRRFIEEAATRYNLQPSVIAGMGSKESGWGLSLKPPGPAGRGDFAKRAPRGNRTTPEPPDGPGYGRGLMQVDYDWHEFARTGQWQIPKENIFYACSLLANFREELRNKGIKNELLLRATIAAYNGGPTATWNAYRDGLDIDANTTGKNYSKEVLNRSGWFQLHGWQ
jgi:soluble lytic murein transglycosylase-like protein